MEFVETPTFWCPHVDRIACTNFSPRTIELRSLESREILPFPFSPFLSFSSFLSFFLFFLYDFFLFLSFLFFFPTNCFLFVSLFPFCFSFFSFSHLIFPSFLLLISLHFSLPFWITMEHSVKGGSFLPLSHAICVALIFFPYFLISFYDIIPYMA